MMRFESALSWVPVLGVVLLSGCLAVQLQETAAAPADGVTEVTAKQGGIPPGEWIYARTGEAGEADDYVFQAQADQPFVVLTEPERGGVDLKVLSPVGRQVHWTSGGAGYRGPISVPTTESYTIRLETGTDPFPSRYRFKVIPVDPAPEKVPAQITIGEQVRGEATDFPGDYDEFKFEGGANETVQIRLQPATAGIEFELLTPSGRVLEALSSGNPELVSSVALPETGTYVLRVRAGVSDFPAPFSASVTRAQ